MKARPVHVVVLAIFLVFYHYGYIYTQPEMIRDILLQKNNFKEINNIAVDASPVIRNYFPLGINKQDAVTIGEKNGMSVGRGEALGFS